MSDLILTAQLEETSRLGMKLLGMVNNDSSSLTKVLANLLRAGGESFGAIGLLCDDGFEREAWIITRTLFEMAVTARYLRKNPDQLESYANFSYMTDKRLADGLLAQGIPLPATMTAMIDEQHASVGPLYKADKPHKTRTKWSEHQIGQMARNVKLGHVYDAWYPMMSHVSHAGYQMMETVARSDLPVHFALCFWQIIIRVLNTQVKGGLKNELDALWKQSPMSTNIHIA